MKIENKKKESDLIVGTIKFDSKKEENKVISKIFESMFGSNPLTDGLKSLFKNKKETRIDFKLSQGDFDNLTSTKTFGTKSDYTFESSGRMYCDEDGNIGFGKPEKTSKCCSGNQHTCKTCSCQTTTKKQYQKCEKCGRFMAHNEFFVQCERCLKKKKK